MPQNLNTSSSCPGHHFNLLLLHCCLVVSSSAGCKARQRKLESSPRSASVVCLRKCVTKPEAVWRSAKDHSNVVISLKHGFCISAHCVRARDLHIIRCYKRLHRPCPIGRSSASPRASQSMNANNWCLKEIYSWAWLEIVGCAQQPKLHKSPTPSEIVCPM